MSRKNILSRLNFNKPWDERDWEHFFQVQDDLMSQRERQLCFKVAPGLKTINNGHNSPCHYFISPEELFKESYQIWTPAQLERFWKEGAVLQALPIYRQAYIFAYNVAQCYARHKKLSRKRSKAYNKSILPLIENLQLTSLKLLSEVATGHAMGYGCLRVGGNIVRCKRGVAHAETCMALANLLHKHFRAKWEGVALFSQAARLRNASAEWIEILRISFA